MSLIDITYFGKLLGNSSPTTEQENVWQNNIDLASGVVNSYVTRPERNYIRSLDSNTYNNEVYSGNGTSRILLKNFPVTAVDSISVDGSAITDYSIRKNIGMIIRGDDVFPAGNRNIEISYTAGYSTIPSEIKGICGRLALRFLLEQKGEGDGRLGIDTEKIDNITNKEYTEKLLTDLEKQTLNKYYDDRNGVISI